VQRSRAWSKPDRIDFLSLWDFHLWKSTHLPMWHIIPFMHSGKHAHCWYSHPEDLHFVQTVYLFRMNAAISNNCFCEQNLPVNICNGDYVYCEVGTEIVCIADIKVRILWVKGIFGLERHLHEEFTNINLGWRSNLHSWIFETEWTVVTPKDPRAFLTAALALQSGGWVLTV